jgi:hypothetical protein
VIEGTSGWDRFLAIKYATDDNLKRNVKKKIVREWIWFNWNESGQWYSTFFAHFAPDVIYLQLSIFKVVGA